MTSSSTLVDVIFYEKKQCLLIYYIPNLMYSVKLRSLERAMLPGLPQDKISDRPPDHK